MVATKHVPGRRLNVPAIRTLLWEEWHQTWGRVLLLGLLGLLIGGLGPMVHVFGARMGIEIAADDLAGVMAAVAAGCCVLIAGAIHFAHYGRNDLHFSFPTRLMVLPVRTEALVAVRMAYAAVVTAGFYAIVATGIDWMQADVLPLELLPIGAMCAMAYFQAVSWMTGYFRPTPVLIAGMLFSTPLFLLIHVVVITPPEYQVLLETLIFVPTLMLCYVVGVIAVALHRHGTVRHLLLRRSLARHAKPTRRPALSPIRTGRQAQVAIEEQRVRRLLGLSMIVAFVPTVVIVLLNRVYTHNDPGVDLWVVSAWFVLTAAIAGMLLVRFDDRDRRNGELRFTLTRPLSTRALAFARLKGAARAIALAYGVVLAASLLLAVVTGDFGEWVRPFEVSASFGSTLFYMLTLVFLTATVAWASVVTAGPLLIVILSLVALAYIVVGALTGLSALISVSEPTTETLFVLCMGVAVGGVLLGVAWLFRRARQCDLLTANDLLRALAAWVTIAGLVAIDVNWGPLQGGFYGVDKAIMSASLLLGTVFCVAPVAVIPLMVHWERHR